MHIVECILLVKLCDFVTYRTQTIDVLIPRLKPTPRWEYFAWQYVSSNPNFDYYSNEYWDMVQRNFLRESWLGSLCIVEIGKRNAK